MRNRELKLMAGVRPVPAHPRTSFRLANQFDPFANKSSKFANYSPIHQVKGCWPVAKMYSGKNVGNYMGEPLRFNVFHHPTESLSQESVLSFTKCHTNNCFMRFNPELKRGCSIIGWEVLQYCPRAIRPWESRVAGMRGKCFSQRHLKFCEGYKLFAKSCQNPWKGMSQFGGFACRNLKWEILCVHPFHYMYTLLKKVSFMISFYS